MSLAKEPIEYRLYQGNLDDEVNHYIGINNKLILESRGIVEATGARFLLVIGADRIQVNDSTSKDFMSGYNVSDYSPGFINSLLENFALENQVNYLDLLPSFKADKDKNLFFVHDGHWNEAGHDVVARALLEKILNDQESLPK